MLSPSANSPWKAVKNSIAAVTSSGSRAATATLHPPRTSCAGIDQIRLAAPNAKIRFISYPSVFGTGSGVACSGGTGTSAWAYTTDERSTCKDC